MVEVEDPPKALIATVLVFKHGGQYQRRTCAKSTKGSPVVHVS